MIHIFNRAELLTTSNLEKLSGVRDALDAKGIDYKVKSKTSLGSTTARNGRAGMTYGAVPMSDAMKKFIEFIRTKSTLHQTEV